jgi:NADPH:quinone reductase-like Zn-dependent oxidoreductase
VEDRQAQRADTNFPVIPGWDIAGVVQRPGLATPEFAPGDEVIGYICGDVQRAHGGMAELVSTDARNLVRKPRALSFAEAAGLPLAGLIAYRAIAHVLDVQPGEILLVHGAAGGVGSLAVQIAPDLVEQYLACLRSPRGGTQPGRSPLVPLAARSGLLAHIA